MVDYANPVLKSVLARDVIPFVPVWLFGIVLAALLDTYRVANGGVPPVTFFEFALAYSAVVGGLVFSLFYRHYRSSPTTIRIDVDGIVGFVPRSGGAPERKVAVEFPYSSFFSVSPGGFFGPRVTAHDLPKVEGSRVRGWDWLHLTPDNALRVAEAYRAWAAREGVEMATSPGSGGVVPQGAA
jgi:hypothetical protein